MNYQLKEWKQNGTVTDNGDGTASVNIIVFTSIVGDKYGFTPCNIGQNTVKVTWSKTKTQNDIEALCEQAAKDYVSKTYPNT